MNFKVFTDRPLTVSPVVLLVGVLTFALGLYRLLRVGSRDKRLPPGPPTIPILGNLLSVPKSGLGLK